MNINDLLEHMYSDSIYIGAWVGCDDGNGIKNRVMHREQQGALLR